MILIQLTYIQIHSFFNYIYKQADEAYEIGKPGEYSPVGAYLAVDEIVKIAKRRGVSIIHPGKDKINALI